eukprot:COSAG06_NODE_17239_length_953_cov_2.163934_1_plen_69_part_10
MAAGFLPGNVRAVDHFSVAPDHRKRLSGLVPTCMDSHVRTGRMRDTYRLAGRQAGRQACRPAAAAAAAA